MTRHHHTPKNLENASEFRLFVYELTESKSFGAFVLFIILLNTVILVVQTDEAISIKGGWYFSAMDNVFLAIYIMELILKLYALGSHFFNSGWNVMDMFIVLFTTVDFLLPLIVRSVGAFDVAAIFRVLRTIRFLKNLQVIMTTILKSFRALSTIVLLMFLFLYMFAVIGRELFSAVDPKRFGSLAKALVTLFQLITLDDWFYMYTDIINVDPAYGYVILYLALYIVLENFIFMNLFVAVLVDNFQRTLSATEKNKKAATKTVFQPEEDEDSGSEYTAQEEDDDEFEDEDDDLKLEGREPKGRAVGHFFPAVDEKKAPLLAEYYQILSSLDYNYQQMVLQFKTLDDLTDITASIPDVPEDLI